MSTLSSQLRTIETYDLLLAIIPLAIVAGALVGSTATVSFTVGMAGGSLAAAVCVWYAVFGVPPGHDRDVSTSRHDG